MKKLFISLLAVALCTVAQAQTRWVVYDQQYGYNPSSIGRPVEEITQSANSNAQGGNMLDPYKMMRKVGGKDNFHFAKDYPELAPYTMPENTDIKIAFYSLPSKNTAAHTALIRLPER